jgi:hypothetical protein
MSISLVPLSAGQAFSEHSVTPIRPRLPTDDPAPGADQLPAQVKEHGIVGPAISVDDRAVVAVGGVAAIDQQPPDPVLANITERGRRASVLLAARSPRWIVVGIAVAHQVNTGALQCLSLSKVSCHTARCREAPPWANLGGLSFAGTDRTLNHCLCGIRSRSFL